jgi:gluconokinase
VLSCSALKRSYRDTLRAACTDLRFVYLAVGYETALARVGGRGQSHFFSPSLVRSQFEALEPPDGESGVLRLDGEFSQGELLRQVKAWLTAPP